MNEVEPRRRRAPQAARRVHARRPRVDSPHPARRLGHRLAQARLRRPTRRSASSSSRRSCALDDPADRARMEHVKGEAIAYLRRQFDYPIPRPVERATVPELLHARVRARPPRHVRLHDPQVHAHHPPPRRARAALPPADVRPGGLPHRRGEGLPGHRRHAGRAAFPSSSSSAAERTRTRSSRSSSRSRRPSPRRSSTSCASGSSRARRDDIFPILQYLTQAALSRSTTWSPGRASTRSSRFRSYVEKTPLRPLLAQLQAHGATTTTTPPATTSSRPRSTGSSTSWWTCRSACPGASSTARPPSAAPLGNVIFVICEFQIVDRDTETHNELGDASHAKYKDRQKKAVMRRLQLGGDRRVRTLGNPRSPDVRKKK